MSRPSFDAIVFDVGGVLVQHDNDLIYATLAARCRSDVSSRDIAARLSDPKIDTGARPVSDLRAELVRDLGYRGDEAQFLADWCCHFTFDASMIALAHGLETRVLLFSNTNREHWDFLLANPANELASFERYLSHELGLAKPGVASYRRVASEAGIDPARSLFLDDRPENVDGARRAGFHAEMFAGEAWLLGHLADNGLR